MGISGWLLWGILAVATANPPVSVGKNALTFSLPALTATGGTPGAQISLSSYVGVQPASPKKAVVLYFFSRAQGADQLDALSRIQRRHAERGVQVLAINTDAGAVGGLSAWLEEQQLAFPVLRDNHHVVLDRYGLQAVPFTVVVDQDGYIFAMGAPAGADFTESIEAELAPLLSAASAPAAAP